MVAMNSSSLLWITGPAGSGKDEACRMLKKRGFFIIDADKIGHAILNKKKRAVQKVFGPAVIKNGRVDRKALGHVVFGSRSALRKLDNIVHPAIINVIRSKVRASKRNKIAINAALYKQLRSAAPDAFVISILASRGTRVKRLLLSRNKGLKEVRGIISAQEKDSYYKETADAVILNDSSLEDLGKKLAEVLCR
jgi:dephospho-CoA kinase